MKLITELEDDEKTLKALYEASEVVERCLNESNIINILKQKPILPVVPSGVTDPEMIERVRAERLELIKEQNKKNIRSAVKRLMVEKPSLTVEMFRAIVVLDDGEEYPKGFKLVLAMTKALLNQDIIDFFSSLMPLMEAL